MFIELRYAVRQLRKNAGFSAITILILAVAVGVNTSVFTVVNAVLIRPLPFPDAERVLVAGNVGVVPGVLEPVTLPDVREWGARSRSFSDLAWWTLGSGVLKCGRDSRKVMIVESSDNLFRMLGRRAHMGLTYGPEDDAGLKQSGVVLSMQAWREGCAGDPNILQHPVTIGAQQYSVLGVMPERFGFPADSDRAVVWRVLPPRPELESDSLAVLSVGGRLRGGVSAAAAQDELTSIRRDLSRGEGDKRVAARGYRESLVGDLKDTLTSTQIAVIVLWLIACANLAGLFLTRLLSRRREIALRSALGATAGRILRQFICESALTALIAGGLGVALASACLDLFRSYLVGHVPFGDQVGIDATVLAGLVLLSVLSVFMFGVLPAWYVSRSVNPEMLRDGTAGAGVSRRQGLLRDGLAVLEIACTLALLTSAGLLIRSVYTLRGAALGFAPEHLINLPILAPPQQFGDKDITRALYEPLIQDIERIPGVSSAAFAPLLPLSGSSSATFPVEIAGRPPLGPAETAELRVVSPALYATLKTQLLQGRTLTEADSSGAPLVAVVNKAFVTKYLPNLDPLGQQIRVDSEGPRQFASVVGVIADMPQRSLVERAAPEVNLSYKQAPEMASAMLMFGQVAVRTRLPPEQVIPAIRGALERIAPELVGLEIKSYDRIIDESLETKTLLSQLLSIFAAAGLVIAVAGVYTLLAHGVARRRQEFAIRLALGATRADVLVIVLRHAAVIIAAGIAGGLAASAAVGRSLRSFLYGIGPYDLFTVATVAAILAAVALVASLVPARRAMRTDPAAALKYE